jgi:hypothetical protein
MQHLSRIDCLLLILFLAPTFQGELTDEEKNNDVPDFFDNLGHDLDLFKKGQGDSQECCDSLNTDCC